MQTRDPVGSLPVDQMSDNIERTKCLGTFVLLDPLCGETLENCFERFRSTLQDFDRLAEIELNGTSFRWPQCTVSG